MRISHYAMAASALVALALPLAACSATDAATGEDDADEIAVEADNAGTPVPLPYRSAFGTSRRLGSRPFEVRGHTAVSVTVAGKWSTPATCHLSTFRVTLYSATAKGPGKAVSTREVPADGKDHVEIWRDLAAGEYALELSTTNTVSACRLVGSVDIVDR